ncbi:MAG: hypothetical protein KF825_10005 [Ferruginibacter sp.]|nr:hypothetical protein [Bacteroidota bacterium]MBX2934570.1 hypothetical protein [Ferruginibacter sp.]
MKKFFVFLGLLIISYFNSIAQDYDYKVGKVENGKAILTINTKNAFSSLSKNLLSASNIKETYTKVELIKLNDNFFALVFQGEKYRTSFSVKEVNGELVAKVKVSCTTTGTKCSQDGHACTVSQNVGECACTPCPAGETCTKTCSSDNLID